MCDGLTAVDEERVISRTALVIAKPDFKGRGGARAGFTGQGAWTPDLPPIYRPHQTVPILFLANDRCLRD